MHKALSPCRGEGLGFSFLRRKGQGRGSEFYGRRPVPIVPSPLARYLAGVAERAPMAIHLEPTDTRVPHQQEAAGWPLYPTISCWPARPSGCVKQIATLGQNWQPRRTTAGPAQGRYPGGIEHGRSGRAAHTAGKATKQNRPPPFLRRKDLRYHPNRANPRKDDPRMIPPLRA